MFDFAPDHNQETDLKLSSACCQGMLYAAVSFAVVSIIAYSIWAFRLVPGRYPMFASVAVIYLALSGFALGQLVVKPGSSLKFSTFFALSFLVYAIFYCLFWFGLKGKFHGDLYGSFVGLAAMTWMFRKAFASKAPFLPLFAVLFTFHTLGYYLGGEAHALVSGPIGRLLWGVAHGLGFGAGLGYLLYNCQAPE